MVEFQKNGQKSSIIFGTDERDYGTSCSTAVNYKQIDIAKRKHWTRSQQSDGNKKPPSFPTFDKESLIKTSFVLGNEKPCYNTETKSNYVARDLKAAKPKNEEPDPNVSVNSQIIYALYL